MRLEKWSFFKRSRTEYRFIDETHETKRFDDFDSLLDTMVDGKKLREILDEIKF